MHDFDVQKERSSMIPRVSLRMFSSQHVCEYERERARESACRS